MSAPARILATEETLRWTERLRAKHGPLVFYQHHGCCEGGAAPVCLPLEEYRAGQDDRLLGEISGCPFYMSGHQFEQWRNVQATIDVAPGFGSGFSLEATEGVGFFMRLRLFSDTEIEQLALTGEPPRVRSKRALQLQEEKMLAPARVEATPEALLWIVSLKAKHGPLLFYQSGGCCEGSAWLIPLSHVHLDMVLGTD